MRSRRWFGPFQAAVLVAVLLAAQTAALVHSDFDDAHPASEVCTLCVGLATLGTGNVAAPHHLDIVVQQSGHTDYVLVERLVHRVDRRFARGPPRAS